MTARMAKPGPTTFEEALALLRPLDSGSVGEARQRQDQLTKPRGALGVLEDVSVQLAGLAGISPPPVPGPAAVAVFAADHGVHAQQVTPWPQEVTTQMVANILAGGAAVTVLAQQLGARVVVVDIGVAGVLDPADQLIDLRVRSGTRDLSVESAMTRQEARAALDAGVRVASQLVAEGAGCLLTGDMGIANTTASAALIAAFTGNPPLAVTGRGTGVDNVTLLRKIAVIDSAMVTHAEQISAIEDDPIAVLAALGGLEHAAIAGFLVGGAALRVPVILDGVIAGAAALVARALAPTALDACIAGHCSAEPGHAVALDALGMRALIDLDLRLGEGTGAVLAFPLVQAAAAILRDMATFDGAGVTDKGTGAATVAAAR